MEQQSGQIEMVSARSAFGDTFAFVARDAEGATILQSGEIRAPLIRIGNANTDRERLRLFVNELAVLGWQAVPTGEAWYAHRLYFRGPGNVSVATDPARREGLSPTAMWGWTIAIVLVLFVVCVFLVFTTELQIRPAA